MTAKEGGINVRLIAIAVLAVAILVALIVATGGGFPSQSGGNAPAPAPPATPPAPRPAKATPPAAVPSGQIQGTVSEVTHRLGGHAWQFLYTVRNTGKVPIAGFQLNGLRVPLYHLTTRSGWGFFGTGCGGNYPNVLIYWSTGSTSPSRIGRGQTAMFGFKAETASTTRLDYSLSFGQAHPAFGVTTGPAPSTLPAPGGCGT